MPKILHRIFFNFNDGPDPFLPFLDSWRRELPDFEIKMWDKTNLPLDLNAYTRTLAAEKNHAYLSDYFRCWLLEKYGGVYLDADIEILDGDAFRKVYDDCQAAADYQLFIGVESAHNGKLTAHSMGVKDGTFHPIFPFLMDLYENAFSGPLHYAIKNFDMPFLMSLFFLDKERTEGYTMSTNGRFRELDGVITTQGMRIYPPPWFSPLTTRTGKMLVSSFSENTCICHHFAATWRDGADGLPRAKCFRDALRDGDYYALPELVPTLRRRYGKKGLKTMLPAWTLKESQIRAIERILNRLIPYGTPLYRMMRRAKKK